MSNIRICSSRSSLRLHAGGVVSTPFVSSVDNEAVIRVAVSTITEYSPDA